MTEHILIDRNLVKTMSELLEMICTALECGHLVPVDGEGQRQTPPTDSLRRASEGLREMLETPLPPEIVTLLRQHLQQAGEA